MARTRRAPSGTRDRILAAAIEEFGARGFDAATVDRISRRARVNKAMIYYHFSNKRALYTAIVRELYTGLNQKLRAATGQSTSPAQQLDNLIDTFVHFIDASRHFLPIFLREIADGGVHLGADELSLIADIFATVRGVIVEGADRKVFQAVNPGLAHFTLIGPVIMFRATAPVRERIKTVRRHNIPDVDSATLVAHLQMVARRMLAPLD
jgi:AcrR family transcriptional regulator